MRKKFSEEEFLEMELEMKMLTCKTPVCYFTWKVKDILDVFSLFYQTSVEEKNDSLLVAAIKNPFVPWIWCEHVAFAHPEQINQTNSGKLPICYVNPKSKRKYHSECDENLSLTRLLFTLFREN